MTPREFRREVEGFVMRRRDGFDRDLSLAWHGAAFYAAAFAGKLPPLEKVLAQSVSTVTGTAGPASRKALVSAWSEFMGVKPQPISDAAKAALARMKGVHG